MELDLGPLFAYLWAVDNLVIMLSCSIGMEVFKRGPATKQLAASRWGHIGMYYAPFAWAWLFLLLPFGLGPEDAHVGELLLLGILLGGATSKVYDIVIKTLRHLRPIPERGGSPEEEAA